MSKSARKRNRGRERERRSTMANSAIESYFAAKENSRQSICSLSVCEYVSECRSNGADMSKNENAFLNLLNAN